MKKTYNLLVFVLSLALYFSFSTYKVMAQPGSLDFSFDPGSGANDFVHTISLQNDGKVFIGGGFTEYNGTQINNVARLDSSGVLDTIFNPGTGTDYWVTSSAIQNDGKILIGGIFSQYDGNAINCIARLHPDGSLDTTFSPGNGANNEVWTISVQDDDHIIIGGAFTEFHNDTTINNIARLHPDGSLDTTFNPAGTGANNIVYTTSLQDDGKIVVGGQLTTYNDDTVNRILRLDTNGMRDTTFNPGPGANDWVVTSLIQDDGKIFVAGRFTSMDGIARGRVARLHTDGSLDTTFGSSFGADGKVWTSSIQEDGKIIIGGQFTHYDWVSRKHIARLNTDGLLDTIFDPGTGVEDSSAIPGSTIVMTSAIQPDSKIIIGGSAFTHYNGTSRNHIARLHDSVTTNIDDKKIGIWQRVNVYPNPASDEVTLILTDDYPLFGEELRVILYNASGTACYNGKHRLDAGRHSLKINISKLPQGMYWIHISSPRTGEYATKKVLVR